MVTLVGKQHDFKDVVYSLLELEYDALEAYKVAIEKLEDKEYKSKMREFKKDHEQHIRLIRAHYKGKLDLPDSAELIKGSLVKLKVIVSNWMGSDNTILKAMLDNEKDTNTAYERVTKHIELDQDSKALFVEGYLDEKKHKAWLEQHTK